MNESQALWLLSKCRGDEVWSLETCRQERVPETWIDELQDAHESGFNTDRQTLYVQGRVVNQYHGVHDLKLAYKLAEYLNVDWETATRFAVTWTAEVRAIQEAVDE